MSGAPAEVAVEWAGEGRFDARRPDASVIRLDSNGQAGPTPFDALLCALGSCASVDVIEILAKRRTPVSALEVTVHAERADGIPRSLKRATLDFSITGPGIERVHAERAVDLAVTKYCSVRDSLREDIVVDWTLSLNSSHAAESSRPVAAHTAAE